MDNRIANFINFAFAVCNNNGNVILLNQAVNDLWLTNFNLNNYATYLTLTEMLEVIRENGNYPEPDDFREHVNKLNKVCGSYSNYSHINKLTLANGSIIEEHITKQNNLFFIAWHNVSTITNLNYVINTQKNILNKFINNNPIPTIIVNNNGLVKEYNFAFSQYFNITKDTLNTNPHINTLISTITADNLLQQQLIYAILNTKNFNININNTAVAYGNSLQNNSVLITFTTQPLSVNTTQLQNTLANVYNNLILSFNHIVTPSITNINALANMLLQSQTGQLNIRQQQYVNNIIQASNQVNKQLAYKNQLIQLPNTSNTNQAIDFNIIIANIMQWLQPKLLQHNVSIQINVEPLVNNIVTNSNNITNFLHLCLDYIVSHNNNSQIILNIEQQNNITTITIKDTAKAVLFSKQDIENMYNVQLIFALAKQLKGSINYYYKNRAFRVITFSLTD